MEKTKEKLGKIAEDVNGYRGFKMTEDPAETKKGQKEEKTKTKSKGERESRSLLVPSPSFFLPGGLERKINVKQRFIMY